MKALTKSILVLCIIFLAQTVYAQNIYRTQNGTLEVRAILADSALHLRSKELAILLNYEDATFEMQVNPSSFRTGNDSLDEVLSNLSGNQISLTGKLGLEYINTTGHPPLDFQFTGVLSTSNEMVGGVGYLEHITNKGLFSCVLTMNFTMKVEDLGVDISGLNPDDEVQFEVVQIVMNRLEDQ